MRDDELKQPKSAAPQPAAGANWIGHPVGAGLVLLLLVGIAYWPSFRGGFVWDDLILIKKNPLATGDFTLRTIWFGTDFSLSVVGAWGAGLIFGEHALGYRIINAALHGASAVLWWRLLRRLKIPGAWLGAALFAVHPLAVASVAWISELKNTLSLPLALASALAFLKWREAQICSAPSPALPAVPRLAGEREGRAAARRKARGLFAVAVLSFGLALLAKTSVVVLPVLLFLVIWGQEGRVTRRDGLALTPHLLLALGSGGMTLWFQSQQAIRGLTVQAGNFFDRLSEAGTAVWFYLGKALWPVNLCAIYPSWDGMIPASARWLPGLLLVVGLAVSWRARGGWGRPVFMVLGCFTAALFPVLGFFDMYFMVFARVSDHFAYVALGIITAAVGAAVMQIRGQQLRYGAGLVLVAGLVILTQARAMVYATDEALWRDTVAQNPRAGQAHNNLACNLAERGKLAEAIEHFAKATELTPNNAPAHRNLGKGLALLGRFRAAEPHFRRALELQPEDAETLVSYGQALAENGRLEEAAQKVRTALERQPTTATRLLLAAILSAADKPIEAASEYRRVLTTEPNAVAALNNLAWLLATTPNPQDRNGSEAVQLAREACRLTNQQEPVMLGTLAAALAETGDFTNAVAMAQAAMERARAAGNTALAERNQGLMREYQAGRPYGSIRRRTSPR